MENFDRKKHWEHIYQTKALHEVSWYQPVPETSLTYFNTFKIAKTAKIIDIGGGDSFLVDSLLNLGYADVTVLDISSEAIKKAQHRLGNKAQKAKWLVADVVHFKPTETYDFWHDRAAFHFLTQPEDIATYIRTAHQCLNTDGILLIGVFSDQGPTKCSGIEIKQYSALTIAETFAEFFEIIAWQKLDHVTPAQTTQNFIFASFKKK